MANVSQVEKTEEFGKDFRLMHEVLVTAEKVGAGHEFWATLAHSRLHFGELVAVLKGESRIIHDKHFVHDQGDPKRTTKVHSHAVQGVQLWDPEKVKLVKSRSHKLVRLSYHYFEFLKNKPFLIPNDWIGKRVIFTGTTFSEQYFKNYDPFSYALRIKEERAVDPQYVYLSDDLRDDDYFAVMK